MALVLAANDIVAPIVVGALAASTQPPIQGIVTGITPTTVVWQDGREQTFSSDASANTGLAKFVADFSSPFLNRKVRPKTVGSGEEVLYAGFADIDHRAEGIVVLTGSVTGGPFTDHPVAIIRLNVTGLYVVLSQVSIEVIPGA
jgi:hypothetical protein